MKPTYSGFEAKKSSGFAQLPPPGVYVAEIQGVKTEDSYDHSREQIVCMIEITEGEYAGQYHKVYEDQKNSFSDVKYRGTIRLSPYIEGDEDWVRSQFEGNLWCVEQSNPGYHWDWNEKGLIGKKIGINVRKNFYTGRDGKERETTEICRFETVDDVRNGKVKAAKDRVQKKNGSDSSANEYSDVTSTVKVPF